VIETAVECAPGFARRAESLHLRGETAEAMRLLKKGVARFPADLTARLVLARLCRDCGYHDEARDWLASVLNLDAECPAALLQLAELLDRGGEGLGQSLRSRLQAQEPWDPWYGSEDSVAASAVRAPKTETLPEEIPLVPTAILREANPASTIRPEPRVVREVPVQHFTFPVREEEEEPEIEENSAPHVATVTLAEIYLQQGLKEQAAQIYRQLLERQPGDDSVRRRLQEIEGL
jgi:tetratricopeptide (TPR) repeat protein